MKMLRGFDISHYQKNIDYDLMGRRANFVIVKAANGLYKNAKFDEHWNGLEGKTLRGAYLYFLPIVDPVAQAVRFWEIAGKGELRPSLDIEWNSVDGSENHPSRFTDYGELVLACLYKIAELWNDMPAIYSNPSHLSSYLPHPVFTEFPLWIASWGGNAPTIPEPYWKDWYMWQTGITDHGKYYGLITGDKLDVDLMQPGWLDPIIPPEPPQPPQPGTGIWLVLADGLRVRSGPSTSGTSTYGYLKAGKKVQEIGIKYDGANVWVQHVWNDRDAWSAAEYSGEVYMRQQNG